MTAFRAQTDTKAMWGDLDGKRNKEERESEDGKEDVTEIESFLNFQGRAEMNWVCVLLER